MENREFKIIYEDNNLLVIDKPAGLVVFHEAPSETLVKEDSLIDLLLENYPNLKNTGIAPRYGIVHRLDKDTSGILLIAKNNEILNFLQRQFKEGKVIKKYLALVVGLPKNSRGVIKTLIGRSPQNPKKQKVYLPHEPKAQGKRDALTEYRVLKKFIFQDKKEYSLLEVNPKTGRKHQIRVHLAYLGYPLAGDKLYKFKNQPGPKGLNRQFLHASYLKIKVPDNKFKEFKSDLPEELAKILEIIKKYV